ncbi:MAG: GDSL-type esterase/lipase family protein [Candidatus Ornithomonoglobus sp.]
MSRMKKARIALITVFALALVTITMLTVFSGHSKEPETDITAAATPSPTRLPKREAEPVLKAEDIPTEDPAEAAAAKNARQDGNTPELYVNGAPSKASSASYTITTVSDVVFYGDSWMDNSIFKEKYENGNSIMAKGSQWAMYFVKNDLITPVQNAKAVLVVFGLNDWQTAETGLTDSSYMKQFLDKLGEAQPGIPILISRSPHTAQAYVTSAGKDINPRCDTYSRMVEQYCSAHSGFYYVDTTSCLEDSAGWLAYADSSAFHLTQEGYNVWFSAINDVLLKALNGAL